MCTRSYPTHGSHWPSTVVCGVLRCDQTACQRESLVASVRLPNPVPPLCVNSNMRLGARHQNVRFGSCCCCGPVPVVVGGSMLLVGYGVACIAFDFLSKSRTIDVEACRMRHFSGSVLGDARVLATILHHDVRDIDMTNDVAVHCHVLSNHKPAVFASVPRAGRVTMMWAREREREVETEKNVITGCTCCCGKLYINTTRQGIHIKYNICAGQ